MTRRFVGIVLAAAAMVSCSKAFTPETVAGTWALRKVNGSPPPFLLSDDGTTTVTITGGILSLNPNLSYVFSLDVEIDDGNTVIEDTQNDAGTYELIEPDTITFTSEDMSVFSATLQGNLITAVSDGITFEFERL
jgi:hypothetical protein